MDRRWDSVDVSDGQANVEAYVSYLDYSRQPPPLQLPWRPHAGVGHGRPQPLELHAIDGHGVPPSRDGTDDGLDDLVRRAMKTIHETQVRWRPMEYLTNLWAYSRCLRCRVCGASYRPAKRPH